MIGEGWHAGWVRSWQLVQSEAMKGFEEGSTVIQHTCNPQKAHLALVPCLHSMNQESGSAAQILPGVPQTTQSLLSPNPLASGFLDIPCTLSTCPGAPSLLTLSKLLPEFPGPL